MKRTSIDSTKIYRLFYPSVPAIVAAFTRGVGGTDRVVAAMPVVSIISLSNDPPLVGLASDPAHSTYEAIVEAGCFSISWLGSEYQDAVKILGTTTAARTTTEMMMKKTGLADGEEDDARKKAHGATPAAGIGVAAAAGSTIQDKLTAAGLHYTLGGGDGALLVPILDEASAVLECAVSKMETFGDHVLITAEVKEARVDPLDYDDYWTFKRYHPILYTGLRDGRFGTFGGAGAEGRRSKLKTRKTERKERS